MTYGHRNDPEGFHRCLQEIDAAIPDLLAALGPDDLLLLTSDHGCDPTTPSTDHSREYALLLAHAPGRPPAGRHDGEFRTWARPLRRGSARATGDGLPGTPSSSGRALRAVELIERKRDGAEHAPGEVTWLVAGTSGAASPPSRSIPRTESTVVAIPEHIDPPLQKTYRQVINAHFTPQAVARFEAATRDLVNRLIDEFVEAGQCDFMTAFARPFPGLAFFDLVLNAPSETVGRLNDAAMAADQPDEPGPGAAWATLNTWIAEFVADRRAQPPRGDVVDAILGAEIDGPTDHRDRDHRDDPAADPRRARHHGGRARAFMIRFTREPEIPALLREDPGAIARAVEELLRLEDRSSPSPGPRWRHGDRRAGHRAGDKVLDLLGVGQPRRGRVPRARTPSTSTANATATSPSAPVRTVARGRTWPA